MTELSTKYSPKELSSATAIATAKMAIQIAQSQGHNDIAEQFDRWLTDYRNHAASAPAK